MRVPEPLDELYDAELEIAVRRALPFIHSWLNGNGPTGYAIRIPVDYGRGLFRACVVEQCHYWAPAPWAGRVYRYVWPVAMVNGIVIAHGEPYRVFDDYATLLADLGTI